MLLLAILLLELARLVAPLRDPWRAPTLPAVTEAFKTSARTEAWADVSPAASCMRVCAGSDVWGT